MSWVVKLRLWTGLVLAVYVVLHLGNHALGLVSFDALDAYRRPMSAVWRTPPMTVLLHGSLLTHWFLALYSLYSRTTLRMPRWQAAQLTLGLVASWPVLLHVVGTRIRDVATGADSTGHVALVAGAQQLPAFALTSVTLLVVLIWIHVALGLHFWLRLKPGYRRVVPALYAVAVVLPVLSLLGFYRAMATVDELPVARVREAMAPFVAAPASVRDAIGFSAFFLPPIFMVSSVALALGLRAVRLRMLRSRGGYRVRHPARGTITSLPGRSVLEALRDAGVPHAAVCGGRGRCTTCRVHLDSGADHVAPPGDAEGAALLRVTSDPHVRLACMLHPTGDVSVTPMLPSNATARDALRGGVSGREQIITAMFVDLRESTKLGEQRLPYDVVFLLNQFFAEMSAALDVTRGHYAQFSGDGLLALYGLEGAPEDGARDALRGATEMKRRLADLNARLADELPTPLRIGIGVHTGEAIVGTMGPPSSPNLSAIGDNINIAARLESMCKELECDVVVSAATAERAGADLSDHPREEVAVRGRNEPVVVFATCDVDDFGV